MPHARIYVTYEEEDISQAEAIRRIVRLHPEWTVPQIKDEFFHKTGQAVNPKTVAGVRDSFRRLIRDKATPPKANKQTTAAKKSPPPRQKIEEPQVQTTALPLTVESLLKGFIKDIVRETMKELFTQL